MNKVKCASDKHVWICKEESGYLNEITTFRPLTEKAICLKGAIICSRCSEYLNEDHHPKTDLSQKLKSLLNS